MNKKCLPKKRGYTNANIMNGIRKLDYNLFHLNGVHMLMLLIIPKVMVNTIKFSKFSWIAKKFIQGKCHKIIL